MKRNMFKRMIVLMLAMIMTVTSIPMSAMASEVTTDSEFSAEDITELPPASEEPGESVLSENEAVPQEETEEIVEELEGITVDLPMDQAAGVTVNVGSDKVTVTISGVGTSGTAKLYRYDANAYYTGDDMNGMSKVVNKNGTAVGNYTCGSTQQITFDRYDASGKDALYSKYYVIQNNAILAGPFYATVIESQRNVQPFPQASIKGITLEDHTTIELAKEMGVSNTVINMDLGQLILANEDANGNPISYAGRSDVISFVSNGKTFYFDAGYVNMQDHLISAYSKEGMNVNLVVITWAQGLSSKYPSSLLYVAAKENNQTAAFNTSTDKGREYWIAAMEFMADRYSKSAETGLVGKYIIGNEIDYAYDWYLLQPNKDKNGKMQKVEFNTFMEEYTRTLRLANNAVKKYNAGAKACISLTHNWAENAYDSYKQTGDAKRYNSYAPKDMLDWMAKYEKARGDYDWALAVHPYPITASNPLKTDILDVEKRKAVTGDWKTSPFITSANLELYQLYLQQSVNKYNGKIRPVAITEACICSSNENNVDAEKYKISTYEQAASVAQFYYRAAMLECIDAIAYFQPHDQDTYKLGLMTQAGVKKPVYNVWKYIDTNKSFGYANEYLKYINPNAKSYKDVMAATKSAFDWNKNWNESKIMTRTVETSYNRIFGSNRFKTSLAIADKIKALKDGAQFNTVIIANGMNFADALAGSYLSTVKEAPILMMGPNNAADVQAYVQANVVPGGMVYVLGGTVAIPEERVSGISAAGYTVKRLAGSNRYATNLEILREAGVTDQEILVCTGTGFADSLSASAAKLPILLVGKSLNPEQKAYLSSLPTSKYTIIGGTSAISAAVEAEIRAYGKETTRLGGKNRYETSVMIAREYVPNSDCAVLAYASNFPDGLCGGPLAVTMNAPLILTKTGQQAPAAAYAKETGIISGAVLGGSGLISDQAAGEIFE